VAGISSQQVVPSVSLIRYPSSARAPRINKNTPGSSPPRLLTSFCPISISPNFNSQALVDFTHTASFSANHYLTQSQPVTQQQLSLGCPATMPTTQAPQQQQPMELASSDGTITQQPVSSTSDDYTRTHCWKTRKAPNSDVAYPSTDC